MKLQKNASIKKHEFANETLHRATNYLTYGAKAYRFSKKRKAFKPTTLYLLEEDPSILQYISDSKAYTKTRIFLNSIRDITESPSFSLISSIFKNPVGNAKHLICLDLGEGEFFAIGFKEEGEKSLFWQGLQSEIEKLSIKQKSLETISKDLFIGFDLDGDQTLSLGEAHNLLMKQHIPMNIFDFKKLFNKFDANGNGKIEFTEFLELMKDRLYKYELEDIFRKYCKEAKFCDLKKNAEKPMMTFDEFLFFINHAQDENTTTKELKEALDPFFNDKKEERSYILTYLQFCNYMFNSNNSIFDPKKENVYQDMKQPMTHYYINSSHNTYLLANQLTGESSLQAYINAFLKGCRCVELDCWDGDNKEPIVTHGHTLTSKILFADIIKVVKEYGFRQNQFPIILSIENHCSMEQKDRMAEILVEILGNMLYYLPNTWESMISFPSPKELKHKVLIKDKADLKPEEPCLSDNDEEKDLTLEKNASSTDPSKEKTTDKIVSLKLFKLITVFGTHLKLGHERYIWSISSLSEKQLEKLMEKKEFDIINVNKSSFTRIFPGGFRVDSSNYDPIIGFMAGSQVIALNFQTNDMNLLLYLSKFMDNGGIYSGYVLKPEFLRNTFVFKGYKEYNKPVMNISIEVISAQFLRPLEVIEESVSDFLDPFIEIAVKGIDIDNKVVRTGTVMNNGLNPNFKGKNNIYQFDICCPEIAMLMFTVYDENNLKNEKVAWFAMPMTCMRSGYRVVPLRNVKNLDFFDLSSIYCKIDIT